MKKTIGLIMLVIILRIPMDEWNGFNDFQKQAVANAVGEMYSVKLDPQCENIRIDFWDKRDGYVYVDAYCAPKPELLV